MRNRSSRNSADGFSLVDLLVALTLVLIVTGTALAIALSARGLYRADRAGPVGIGRTVVPGADSLADITPEQQAALFGFLAFGRSPAPLDGPSGQAPTSIHSTVGQQGVRRTGIEAFRAGATMTGKNFLGFVPATGRHGIQRFGLGLARIRQP